MTTGFTFFTPHQLTDWALHARFQNPHADEDAGMVVSPGDVVSRESGVMRGHGTLPSANTLYSTLAGPLTKTNALMTVTAPNARYVGEIGDVVIARIRAIQTKSWKVEMNSKQDAILMLSAIILPGGVQRRKQESDQIMMHTFLKEGDLIAAEVQQFQHDGAASLHTRNLKFVLRSKSQFHTLPFGVDIIFGLNGYIWMTPAKSRSDDIHLQRLEVTEEDSLRMYSDDNEPTNDTERGLLARTSNLIRSLAAHHLHISDVSLALAYEVAREYETERLLNPEVQSTIALHTRIRLADLHSDT